MSAVATVVTEIIIELEKWNISLAESGKLLNFFFHILENGTISYLFFFYIPTSLLFY
jgi:hypothetical protein